MTHYIENYTFPYKQRGAGSVARTNEKLTGLSQLSHFLVGTETIEDLIDHATGYIVDLLHIDFCRIFILESDGHYALKMTPGASEGVIQELFARIAASQEPQRPLSVDQYMDIDSRRLFGLSEHDSTWIIPLSVEDAPVGTLMLVKRNAPGQVAFPKDIYYLVDLIADQLGNALHRKQLNQLLVNSSIETVLALSKTLETRDPYSGAHSQRLASYSEKMARHFNLSVRETRELCWAALLHDIGKIGIEDQILHKPGPLTAREWEIMKTHSEVGAQIVKGLSGLENISSIILSHHERMDGTGYPRQLRGEHIPLGARIIAVEDSYSAMTEGRIYCSPRTHEEAIAELKKCSGSMYDPEVVEAFILLFGKPQDLD